MSFGPVDKVLHNQKIAGITFTADYIQLIFSAVENRLIGTRVAVGKLGVNQFFEVAFGGFTFRHGVLRVDHLAGRDNQIDFVGNLLGILNGFGQISKEIGHFFGAFEIKAGRIDHGKAIFIVKSGTRLDGQEGVLGPSVVFADIVNIVSRDQRNSKFAGKSD